VANPSLAQLEVVSDAHRPQDSIELLVESILDEGSGESEFVDDWTGKTG